MTDPADRRRHLDGLWARTAWLEAMLEFARSGLDAELAAAGNQPGGGCDFDDDRPEWEDVWDFVHAQLIPEIDRALEAYESGLSQVEFFNWQVGPLAVTVSITSSPEGVLIDSTMAWFARKLYNHYSPEGYTVEAMNHQDDEFMQQPTLVRIRRT